MRRGAAGTRARAAALALCVVGGLGPAAPGRAEVDLPPGGLTESGPAAPIPRVREAPEAGLDASRGAIPAPVPRIVPPPGASPAVRALVAELNAVGEAYDGFVLGFEEVGLLDHLRSLLGSGRLADPIVRGTQRVEEAGGDVERPLRFPFPAVVADLTVAEALLLADDPAVLSISPNALVELGARRVADVDTHLFGAQFLWGLGVLDSAVSEWVGSGGAYPAGYSDIIDRSHIHSTDGAGVDVFIVDTGIDVDHPDVASRIVPEAEYQDIGGYYRIRPLGTDGVLPGDDCNGHGTHVAGTVAGVVSGVAPGARLVPVKVFPDCALGTTTASHISEGVYWIADAVALRPDRPYVVNMSLGTRGGRSATIDTAVQFLVAAEEDRVRPALTVVVAAGNDTIDATNVSPAWIPGAITVGALGNCVGVNCATLYYNERAGYSNYGSALDIMAPGTWTWSACPADNRFNEDANGNPIPVACVSVTIGGVTYPLYPLNGTSMATPMVAGVAARLLGDRYAADGTVLGPAEAAGAITAGGLSGVLDQTYSPLGGSPNLVVNTRFLEPEPLAPGVPVVIACAGGATASALSQLPAEGVGPFTWSVTAGTPPSGLTLSPEGRLTGSTTPSTQTGTVTLQVEDPFGRTATATFSRSAFPAGCVG